MKTFKTLVETSYEDYGKPSKRNVEVKCSSCDKKMTVEVEKNKWSKKAAESGGHALYAGKNIMCKECIKKNIRTPGQVK